ncbi:winged helix-turn-helix domain-containing protein [Brevibacterium zhoupengii]|uniref:winged helix-turn-helix domain-containing protein n=1 Tax=Brevibacterium zhoupengii TaxID=2898795 RepID=UPI0023DE0A15|nr:winged helix-turn-helix domain-containing protein [Brevibacterium zhoupengii]
MRILHICPTARLESPLAPESLQYLGHQVERLGLDQLNSARTDLSAADVIVADACLDLSLAPAIAEAVARAHISAPIVVVLSEGGLATASAKWNVSDIVLTTAGPAEVEARLRLARDHHLSTPSHEGASRGGGGGASTAATVATSGTSRAEAAYGGGPWISEGDPMVVVSGALRIDETAFTAHLGKRSLDLTYREFALLKFFAMHPERVFTRDEILLEVWGDDYYGGTRTVDVHVRRVRAKLGKDFENAIHTVRYVGYRFSPDSAAARGDSANVHDDPAAAHDGGAVPSTDDKSEPDKASEPDEESPPEAQPESNEEDLKV